MSSPLIIETAGRLPGPLAASVLLEHGLEVIKLEHKIKRDPFSIDLENRATALFNFWYKNLRKGKNHFLLSHLTKEIIHQVSSSLKNKSGLILITGGPKDPLTSVANEIKKHCRDESIPFCQYSILSDISSQALHDLDMCTEVGLINQRQTTPLRYPVMGLQFANRIALKALTETFSTEEKSIFFREEINNSYQHLLVDYSPTPIEGEMVAYRTYQLKDGAISLTALEKKNWKRFCELVQLPLEPKDRFAKKDSPQSNALAQKLKTFKKNEVKEIFISENVCFTFIK